MARWNSPGRLGAAAWRSTCSFGSTVRIEQRAPGNWASMSAQSQSRVTATSSPRATRSRIARCASRMATAWCSRSTAATKAVTSRAMVDSPTTPPSGPRIGAMVSS